MESNWAAENLQTIRTLMERSALYRRALAPISTCVGVVGLISSAIGWHFAMRGMGFVFFWLSVSLVALIGAFLLVRRQALKEGEAFWSPPTRRVVQAMFPCLLVGLLFSLLIPADPLVFVLVWSLLYGLALQAAGFFMMRGVRLFGWCFIIVGLVTFFITDWGNMRLNIGTESTNVDISPHLLMGVVFGLSHLAYGIYLYFTEPRKNEA